MVNENRLIPDVGLYKFRTDVAQMDNQQLHFVLNSRQVGEHYRNVIKEELKHREKELEWERKMKNW